MVLYSKQYNKKILGYTGKINNENEMGMDAWGEDLTKVLPDAEVYKAFIYSQISTYFYD